MTNKKLQRTANNRMIAGICGGIAEYFGWNSSTVRFGFLALIALLGGGIWLYIILWFIMPLERN